METDNLFTALDYVDDNTLFIVDIDNTLIESTQQLGSIQWIDYLAKEYAKEGKTYEEVDSFVSYYWLGVQPYIKVRCVDPKTPTFFNKLNSNKIKVLGLTARRPIEMDYTFTQLTSVDIKWNSFIDQSRVNIDFKDKESTLFGNGILFSTPVHSKSTVLEAFLSYIDLFPKKIVFVDDKWDHVADLENFSRKLNIDYTGVRFNGCDERVKAFNPKIAHLQYEYLPNYVTDEEAEAMVTLL